MPVYVTGAHVTLNDGKRSHSKNSGTLKRPFYFKDTCKTPYFFRTLLVIFTGLMLVACGTIMTITGYKPTILLPWYAADNNVTATNKTNQNTVSDVLGEPGPLRIMIYTGPVLMGVGFFGVMMAVVLFCEIKDRYLMAILPTKGEVRKIKKDMLYDMIINEFRKNYFRGIEVPIHKEVRKKSSFTKWSFSLSGSASSFVSFARRHSHDFFKLAKRKQKAKEKWKNETFPKRSTSDSWMKTSSLPDIKHKTETVELEIMAPFKQTAVSRQGHHEPTGVYKTGVANLEDTKVSGVDNLAYRDSPSNKKLKTQTFTGEDESETLTTVVVHNISKPPEDVSYQFDNLYQNKCAMDIYSNSQVEENNEDSFREANKYTEEEFPGMLKHTDGACDKVGEQNIVNIYDIEKSNQDDSEDVLGMSSDTSSLSIVWDDKPLEWSDARRNTEPSALFRLRRDSTATDSNDDNMQTTTKISTTTKFHNIGSKLKMCTFKTVIRVFRSESSLSRSITPPIHFQEDKTSIDSLELTDEMLKNFDMAEISHI